MKEIEYIVLVCVGRVMVYIFRVKKIRVGGIKV